MVKVARFLGIGCNVSLGAMTPNEINLRNVREKDQILFRSNGTV